MHRSLILILTGCLILGFQNCARNNLVADAGSGNNLNQISPGAISSISNSGDDSGGAAVAAVEIPSPMGPITVEVDTGRISLVNNQSQVIQQACLSSKDLIELQSYTKNYNLCGETQEAEVCTQQYTAGYASLIIDNQRLNLGESFDGCGKGFKNFCGSQGDSFRGFVSYILKNFASMPCP